LHPIQTENYARSLAILSLNMVDTRQHATNKGESAGRLR
jgi:hypothetical protein